MFREAFRVPYFAILKVFQNLAKLLAEECGPWANQTFVVSFRPSHCHIRRYSCLVSSERV